MSRRMKFLIAAGLGLAMVGGTAYAYTMQGDAAAAQLRAGGQVGEQSDGT